MTTKSPETQAQPETAYNLNNDVLVKVTYFGEQIWNDYHLEARLALNNPKAFALERDQRGFSRMPLSEVMQVFGPHMHSVENSPIQAEFYLASNQDQRTS